MATSSDRSATKTEVCWLREAVLDTHVWLWSLLEPAKLNTRVRRLLLKGDSQLWLSSISVWETLLLADQGRLSLDREPARWIDEALRLIPINEAPVTIDVALASRALPLVHEDPADRFIAACAVVHDCTLLTADKRLLACPDVRTLACV